MTAVIPSMYIATAIIIPLQFKYGAEKSRLALFTIFGLIAVLVLGSKSLLKDSITSVVNIINTLQNLSGAVIILILVTFCGIVSVISYLFSVQIMEKKEF